MSCEPFHRPLPLLGTASRAPRCGDRRGADWSPPGRPGGQPESWYAVGRLLTTAGSPPHVKLNPPTQYRAPPRSARKYPTPEGPA